MNVWKQRCQQTRSLFNRKTFIYKVFLGTGNDDDCFHFVKLLLLGMNSVVWPFLLFFKLNSSRKEAKGTPWKNVKQRDKKLKNREMTKITAQMTEITAQMGSNRQFHTSFGVKKREKTWFFFSHIFNVFFSCKWCVSLPFSAMIAAFWTVISVISRFFTFFRVSNHLVESNEVLLAEVSFVYQISVIPKPYLVFHSSIHSPVTIVFYILYVLKYVLHCYLILSFDTVIWYCYLILFWLQICYLLIHTFKY